MTTEESPSLELAPPELASPDTAPTDPAVPTTAQPTEPQPVVDSGADPFTTQSLLGHSSLSQTAKYTHKQIEIKRDAIEGMTGYILSMSKKGKLSNITRIRGTT